MQEQSPVPCLSTTVFVQRTIVQLRILPKAKMRLVSRNEGRRCEVDAKFAHNSSVSYPAEARPRW